MIDQLAKELLFEIIDPLHDMIKLYNCTLNQTQNDRIVDLSSKNTINSFNFNFRLNLKIYFRFDYEKGIFRGASTRSFFNKSLQYGYRFKNFKVFLIKILYLLLSLF